MNIVKRLDEIAAIKSVMQLYIDGADGDTDKLLTAFHADAQMFGHVGDTRRDMPISRFIEGVGQAGPGLTEVHCHYSTSWRRHDPNCRYRFSSCCLPLHHFSSVPPRKA